MRIVVRARQHERHTARWVRRLRKPVTNLGHHRIVECVHEVENLERHLGIDRLALRASLVRLQSVAESAVRIAVSAQRIAYRLVGRPLEQAGEQMPVDQPSVAQHELARAGKTINVDARLNTTADADNPE